MPTTANPFEDELSPETVAIIAALLASVPDRTERDEPYSEEQIDAMLAERSRFAPNFDLAYTGGNPL